MKKYTLAFIFDEALEHVLLMHKNRPEWQAGLINGIGGKVEESETPLECIVRETYEETNLQIANEDWIQVGEMRGEVWEATVFTAIYRGDLSDAKSNEDQKVTWFVATQLPENVIQNLTWLVPLCADRLDQKGIDSFVVNFNERNPT